MNNQIAEFMGWYFGDGCISTKGNRSQFSITGDLKEEYYFYKDVIEPTFNKLFIKKVGKKISVKKYPSLGVCGIYVSSKVLINILTKKHGIKCGKKKDVTIPKFETDGHKKSFLRGLFDTDGSIYFCKSNLKTKIPTFFNTFHYKPKIKLSIISKSLIDYTFQTLIELGFSPRLYKPYKQRKEDNTMYPLVLDTKEDVIKWIKEIDFKNNKHITKIKVWKRYGYCPPYTTINQREAILNGKVNPKDYYHKKEKNL